jgi:hypothetical protein
VSVIISDLGYFGAADMPESDGATTGGAINFNTQVEMTGTAISPAAQFDAVSSSASDAGQITFDGRDSTGLSHTETLTLTGQTKVTSTNSYERLLSALATGAANAFGLTAPSGTGAQAVGDLALMSHSPTLVSPRVPQSPYSAVATTSTPALVYLESGDGASVTIGMVIRITVGTGIYQIRRIIATNTTLGLGADVVAIDRNFGTALDSTSRYEVAVGFYFPLACSSQGVALSGTTTQCLGVTRLFATAAAQAVGGSNETFYEKIFVNNNNLTTALGATGNAQVILQAIGTALPSGVTLEIALANSRNDTSTITTRNTPGTPPSGVTSYQGVGTGITVPSGPGTLPASASAGSATSAQAIWLQLGANAGSPAWESSVTIRTTGTSA